MNNTTDNTTGSDCPAAPCSAFTDEQAHYIANEVKRWLEDGCTISAIGPEVLVVQPDGSIHGGMSIIRQNANCGGSEK